MNILFLKKFNNYANRIVVKYSTLEEYEERAASFITFTDINFNPNDGVMTELVVGNEAQQQPVSSNTTTVLDWETAGSPDYLVCYTTSGTTHTIVSRWFITECVRTRLGQFKLQLKRDSIADHLTSVEDATCFINKGYIENKDDSAIFNKENIATNQVKSDEFLLADETQCPWIVGYVAKNKLDSSAVSFEDTSVENPDASDASVSETYASESEFLQAHQDITGDLALLNSWSAMVNVDIYYRRLFGHYMTGQNIYCYNNGKVSYEEVGYNNSLYLHAGNRGNDYPYMVWKWWLGDYRDTLANSFVSGWKTDSFRAGVVEQIANKENVQFIDDTKYQAFISYINSKPIVKIGTKYYIPYDIYGQEGVNSTIVGESFLSTDSTAYTLFYNNLNLTPQGVDGNVDHIEGTPGPETFKLAWSYNKHALALKEVFSECKAKVPITAPLLKDAPYYMFAIPYSDDLALYSGNTLHCTTKKTVAMNAAINLCEKAGAGAVYDVQLLPYCPIRDAIKTQHKSNLVLTPPATYDYVINIRGGLSPSYYKEDIVKLNHQYVIAKDISARARGISSTSPIKIKFGHNNLEGLNVYNSFDAYKIEVAYEDINDTSSDYLIKIYTTSATQVNPDITLDYATYVAGTDLIGVYCTDICKYSGLVQQIGGGWILEYYSIIGGGRQMGNPLWKIFNDYVYYKDYYTSKVDISTVPTSNIVTVISGVETDVVNTIFWAKESQFTFDRFMAPYLLLQSDGTYKTNVMTEVTREALTLGKEVADIKVKNQTEMIRLASPNYSNFFDINAQINNGIKSFNIDCTYKPYSPYIHVNPDFGGLYGADYNDIRGLICGGDFSVALTNDAWSTYQLQNKNYQAIFDRQMQQLEVQHGIQKEMNIINAITGVGSAGVGGAVTGALTGGKIGGGYGAIAGAIVGGVAGTAGGVIGGAADIYNADRIMELQRSTLKDIHSMQLDNIKALPIGLSKTSYLTNNNKIFPFIEVYKATPIEEMAMRDLIDYNGMTVNRIGKIRDFQSDKQLPYIKAQLIRIDIQDDPHQVTAISSELATGVYLPEGDSDVPVDDSSDSEE